MLSSSGQLERDYRGNRSTYRMRSMSRVVRGSALSATGFNLSFKKARQLLLCIRNSISFFRIGLMQHWNHMDLNNRWL